MAHEIESAAMDGSRIVKVSGAGRTGKTEALVRRAAHLIASGTAPESIWIEVSSRIAGDELRRRLAGALEEGGVDLIGVEVGEETVGLRATLEYEREVFGGEFVFFGSGQRFDGGACDLFHGGLLSAYARMSVAASAAASAPLASAASPAASSAAAACRHGSCRKQSCRHHPFEFLYA